MTTKWMSSRGAERRSNLDDPGSQVHRNRLLLSETDPGGLRPLVTFGDIDDDALAFIERGEACPLQGRGMDEHILAAAIAHDEAEALHGIVPLDRAALLAARFERRPVGWRPEPGARPRRGRGAGIDADDLGDLRAALARCDAQLERLARGDRGDADAPEHGGVQESIARPVGHLDEAEPFFRFEPFDHGANRWTGGFLEARSAAEARCRAEVAWRLLILLIVEGAPTPRAKISFLFQDGFLISQTGAAFTMAHF